MQLLAEIDGLSGESVAMEVIGGAAALLAYGAGTATKDIDSLVPIREAASDCRGRGRYEAGKEGSYRPCCPRLREVFYTKSAFTEGGTKVFVVPELRIYACVDGRSGDGVCEVGEAEPCGCVPDCPSAAWSDGPTGEVSVHDSERLLPANPLPSCLGERGPEMAGCSGFG